MAEAAEAFPAGDPRNALYAETVASLQHAYNTTLAGDRETLSKAQTNSQYQQALLTKAEPGTYAANEHRANAGGILESGINAERRGTIASGYAQKRYAVTSGLHNTEDSVRRADEAAKARLEEGSAKASSRALEEGRRALLVNQPNEPTATATPGAPAAPKPSVVARTYEEPGAGFVKIGGGGRGPATVRPPTLRRLAARKAVR